MTDRPLPEFTRGDIVRMAQPHDWLRGSRTPVRFHRMMAAAMLLMVVLALSGAEIGRIRFSDYRPGKRGTLLVRGPRGRRRTVPVVPELAYVLNALMGRDAGVGGGPVFRTIAGGLMTNEDITVGLQRFGERLGYAATDLTSRLSEPARIRLLDKDSEAARVLLGMVPQDDTIGIERLRALVDACNPVKGLGRELTSPPIGLAYLMDVEQNLPLSAPVQGERASRWTLPEHPVLAALLDARVPAAPAGRTLEKRRRKFRLRLFPDVYPLLMMGEVEIGAVTKLYATTVAKIESWVRDFPGQYDGRTYALPTSRKTGPALAAAVEQFCAEHPDADYTQTHQAMLAAGHQIEYGTLRLHMHRAGLGRARDLRKFDDDAEAFARAMLGETPNATAAEVARALNAAGNDITEGRVRQVLHWRGLSGGPA
jgi:hypothetical protein